MCLSCVVSYVYIVNLQVITQLKTLSAQNKQASSAAAALEGGRVAGGGSHRRTVSESSGCVGGRGIDGGGGGGASAGRKHAVSSLMTLAQIQYKRAAVSKVGWLGGRWLFGWWVDCPMRSKNKNLSIE